jgi:hypothetical protein
MCDRRRGYIIKKMRLTKQELRIENLVARMTEVRKAYIMPFGEV